MKSTVKWLRNISLEEVTIFTMERKFLRFTLKSITRSELLLNMLKEQEIIVTNSLIMMSKTDLSQSALLPLTQSGDSFGTLERDPLTENLNMNRLFQLISLSGLRLWTDGVI